MLGKEPLVEREKVGKLIIPSKEKKVIHTIHTQATEVISILVAVIF